MALAASARFLGRARIRGRLYRVAHYPGLAAPQSEDEWVAGDLFEGVTSQLLQRLDDYEGSDYQRQLAEVTLTDGSNASKGIASYLYYYQRPTDKLEFIPSGDWYSVSPLPSPPEQQNDAGPTQHSEMDSK